MYIEGNYEYKYKILLAFCCCFIIKEYALEIICTHTKETTPNANILGRKIYLNVYKISLPFTSLFISIIFLTFQSTNPKIQPNTVDNIIIIKELTIEKYIISLE